MFRRSNRRSRTVSFVRPREQISRCQQMLQPRSFQISKRGTDKESFSEFLRVEGSSLRQIDHNHNLNRVGNKYRSNLSSGQIDSNRKYCMEPLLPIVVGHHSFRVIGRSSPSTDDLLLRVVPLSFQKNDTERVPTPQNMQPIYGIRRRQFLD